MLLNRAGTHLGGRSVLPAGEEQHERHDRQREQQGMDDGSPRNGDDEQDDADNQEQGRDLTRSRAGRYESGYAEAGEQEIAALLSI